MVDFDQLLRLGPGDKMTLAFTKNPKPSWLESQGGQSTASQPAPASQPSAPAPMPMVPPPPPPMGGAGLPPSPMAMELMKRMGQ